MVHGWILPHIVINIITENGRCGAPRAPDEPLKSPSISPLEPSRAVLSCASWTHPNNMDPLQYKFRLPKRQNISKLFNIRRM